MLRPLPNRRGRPLCLPRGFEELGFETEIAAVGVLIGPFFAIDVTSFYIQRTVRSSIRPVIYSLLSLSILIHQFLYQLMDMHDLVHSPDI